MNDKDLANQQSQDFLNQAFKAIQFKYNPLQTVTNQVNKQLIQPITQYLQQGVQTPKFGEGNIFPEQGITQPAGQFGNFAVTNLAKFGNFLGQNVYNEAINTPFYVSSGAEQLTAGAGKGLYQTVTGQQLSPDVSSNILAGGGKFGKGLLNVGTLFLGPEAGIAEQSLSQIIKQEALTGVKFGLGYGLTGGLESAASLPAEQRLGEIAKQTLVGVAGGALLGGAIPLVGAGAKSLYRYFKPEELGNLSPITNDVVNTVQKDFNLHTPDFNPDGSIKTLSEKMAEQNAKIEPNLSQDLSKKVTSEVVNKDIENIIKPVEPVVSIVNNEANVIQKPIELPVAPQLAKDVIFNVKNNSTEGAIQAIANANDSDRVQSFKYIQTLIDKGQISPEVKAKLQTLIDTPAYTFEQRKSKQAYENAITNFATAPDQTLLDIAKSAIDIKRRLDDLVATGQIPASQLPNQLNIELTTKFGPMTRGTDYTVTDILRAVATELSSSKRGYLDVAQELYGPISGQLTGTGQVIQSASNGLDTMTVIDNTKKALITEIAQKDPAIATALHDTSVKIADFETKLKQELLNNDQATKDFVENVGQELVGKSKNNYTPKDLAKEWEKTINSFEKKSKINELSNEDKLKIYFNRAKAAGNELLKQAAPENQKPSFDIYKKLKLLFEGQDVFQKLVNEAPPEFKTLIKTNPNYTEYSNAIDNVAFAQIYNKSELNNVLREATDRLKLNYKELTNLSDSKILDQEQKLREYVQGKFKSSGFVNFENKSYKSFEDDLVAKFYSEIQKKPKDSIVLANKIKDFVSKTYQTPEEKIQQEVQVNTVNTLYIKFLDTVKEPLKVETDPDKKWKILQKLIKEQSNYSKVWKDAISQVEQAFEGNSVALNALRDTFKANVPDAFTDKYINSQFTKLVKENGINFNELIKQSFENQSLTRQQLENNLAAKMPELSQAEISNAVSKLYQYFNQRLENARLRYYDTQLKSLVPKDSVRKTIVDKLIENANAGVFNHTDIANAMAEKLRLPYMSKNLAQFIADTMPKVQSGELTVQQAFSLIAQKSVEENPVSIIKNAGDRQNLLSTYHYNNIFGFKSQTRNLLGGLNAGLIVQPTKLAGEALMSKFFNSIPPWLEEKIVGRNLTSAEKAGKFSDIPAYYKNYLGSLDIATTQMLSAWDKNYIRPDIPQDINAYIRETRINQLPNIVKLNLKVMESTDQFTGSLIEQATYKHLINKGVDSKEAQTIAFNTREELLGRNNFGSDKRQEVGLMDSLFNKFGNWSIQQKYSSSGIGRNLVEATFPVMKMAINYQKLKMKLFPPTQLINIITKSPANRKLEDYAYLSVGTALMGYAWKKYMDGDVTFAAPKDQKARQLFFDSGRQEYSVRIMGSWVPMQSMDLFSMPFMAMAAWKAANEESPTALTDKWYDKLAQWGKDMVQGSLVGPTYLQSVTKFVEAYQGVNGATWGSALAFPATGYVPYSSYLRDLSNLLDPIKRKKNGPIDEFLALFPTTKRTLEPFRTAEGKPVEQTLMQTLSPFNISQEKPEIVQRYNKELAYIQQKNLFKENLTPDQKRVTNAQADLEVAIREKNLQLASQIIQKENLTPSQAQSVTDKIVKDMINNKITPEQRALLDLNNEQLKTLSIQNPSMMPAIMQTLALKKQLAPLKTSYAPLYNINKISKPKIRKGGITKPKKIGTKGISKSKVLKPKVVKYKKPTVRLQQSTKIKKLKMKTIK